MQKITKNEGHSVPEFCVLKRNTDQISEIKAKYMEYMRKTKEGCEGRSHGRNYTVVDFSGPFPQV
jgi:hypothetical protein